MFKAITLYRIAGLTTAADLAEALQRETFAPCAPTWQKSAGWEPPRAAHGAMVESVGGQWIARFAIETRTVPSEAITERADAIAARIERETGRVPGKRERRDINADALHELLPQAFPRQTAIPVWIDPAAGLLIIGTTTASKADQVVTSLVRAGAGLEISLPDTQTSPAVAMTSWLLEDEGLEIPDEFDLGRECELRGCGQDAPVLRFNRYDLRAEDVRNHVGEGRLPERLGLRWNSRAIFVLDAHLRLRKIEVTDIPEAAADQSEDSFDADVALHTGTLAPLIADLITALGGFADPEEQP